MRLLRTVLEYDGSAFLGFQKQKVGRTVQGDLEKTLTLLLNERIFVQGGGRTDRGVHSLGQVISFETSSPMELETLRRALNAILRPSVAVRLVEEAPPGFHARYSARSRTYQYTLRSSPLPSVLEGRLFIGVRRPLDVERMALASRILLGRHDFKAFSSGDKERSNTLRTVLRLEIRRGLGRKGFNYLTDFLDGADMITFEIEGDAFLRCMVRMMVGTLIRVGTGDIPAAEVEELLEKGERGSAGPPAPPCGLCLLAISY